MSLSAVLELRGERALVVGGGTVATRRVRTLLDAGLQVRVIAPQLSPGLRELEVAHEARTYRPGDLCGERLVVAATDDAAVNDAVTAEAHAAGILVNHAGQAERGSLRFPALAQHAGVQVAISTGRELPMLAQALGEAVTRLLPTQERLDAWTRRREQALSLEQAERAAALDALRTEIRAELGLAGLGVSEASA